jgi:hypothetical protein
MSSFLHRGRKTGRDPSDHPPSLSVLCATWNVGNSKPLNNLEPWIPKNGGGFDVIAVSAQEANWDHKTGVSSIGASLAQATGLSQLVLRFSEDNKFADLLMVPQICCPLRLFRNQITRWCHCRSSPRTRARVSAARLPADRCIAFSASQAHVGPDYSLVTSTQMMQIKLVIFIKSEVPPRPTAAPPFARN